MLGVSRGASSQEHPLPQSLGKHAHTHTRCGASPNATICLKELDGSWWGEVDSRWADVLCPDSWEKTAETPPCWFMTLSEWLRGTAEYVFLSSDCGLSCAGEGASPHSLRVKWKGLRSAWVSSEWSHRVERIYLLIKCRRRCSHITAFTYLSVQRTTQSTAGLSGHKLPKSHKEINFPQPVVCIKLN